MIADEIDGAGPAKGKPAVISERTYKWPRFGVSFALMVVAVAVGIGVQVGFHLGTYSTMFAVLIRGLSPWRSRSSTPNSAAAACRGLVVRSRPGSKSRARAPTRWSKSGLHATPC